ncbi:MAG: exodeoxyribonuclease VII large subunit [Candidatus Enteromonas sp.]|nr:exodeoxyribonuclease VII large subunit [Candidatus Enteromonas sp.]
MSRSFLSVTELASAIKEGIETLFPYPLSVKGEVSNFKRYPSGHAYFSLKDSQCVVSCVIWSNQVEKLLYLGKKLPKDGDLVLVDARVTTFPGRGNYQLNVLSITPFGLGDALLKLEETKKKLAAEGLFDESRKRPLPPFPTRIGVIAGEGSAGMKDIVVNVSARWPLCELVLIPSLVQGEEAPKALCEALEEASKAKLDVLIIGRGGGSKEDLWAFNDETLARKVAAFPVPVISAVGHEIDTTLVDYVSDKRVSTPTAAAVVATPNKDDLLQGLDESLNRLESAMGQRIQRAEELLASYASRPFFVRPESLYEGTVEKVEAQSARLASAIARILQEKEGRVSALFAKLEALDPAKVLGRGYSISYSKDGKIVRSIQDIEEGQTIRTQLKDGIIESTVDKKGESL